MGHIELARWADLIIVAPASPIVCPLTRVTAMSFQSSAWPVAPNGGSAWYKLMWHNPATEKT